MEEKLDRVFIDASFLVARFNSRDEGHQRERNAATRLVSSRELWTTDAVLLEVAASMADPAKRPMAGRIWEEFHGGDARCRSVEASIENLSAAMKLYQARPDKAWSLTDCLSFVVMEREGLVDALTADQHFEQAGFRALLLVG
jgi:uncharacterized protein